MDTNSRKIRAVIDRIEDNIAIIEIDKSEIALPLKLLPKNSTQGSIIDVTLSLNVSEEKKQVEKIIKLQEKLKTN